MWPCYCAAAGQRKTLYVLFFFCQRELTAIPRVFFFAPSLELIKKLYFSSRETYIPSKCTRGIESQREGGGGEKYREKPNIYSGAKEPRGCGRVDRQCLYIFFSISRDCYNTKEKSICGEKILARQHHCNIYPIYT